MKRCVYTHIVICKGGEEYEERSYMPNSFHFLLFEGGREKADGFVGFFFFDLIGWVEALAIYREILIQ